MTTKKRTTKPLTAEQREAKRAYHAAWYQAHKEEIRVYNLEHPRQLTPEQHESRRIYEAAYYLAHRAEQLVSQAAYYVTHRAEKRAYRLTRREEDRAYNAAWYQLHREENCAASAAWQAAHPEVHRARSRRRRALKAGAPVNDFTSAQWKAMQEHYDHRCVYCGKRAKGHLSQDHITPLSAGGSHTLANIVPACRSCNSRKGNRAVLVPVQPLLLLAV